MTEATHRPPISDAVDLFGDLAGALRDALTPDPLAPPAFVREAPVPWAGSKRNRFASHLGLRLPESREPMRVFGGRRR